MKSLLLSFVNYNIWANQRVIVLMQKLNEEQLTADLGSSFHTLKDTAYHIWMAESIWMQRLHLQENIILPHIDFAGSFQEACTAWQNVSNEMAKFVNAQFDDRSFEDEVIYHTLKKEPMKSKVSDIILHCMNHSTFHRGQIIHFLRQLGVTKLPSTDFITYTREKK